MMCGIDVQPGQVAAALPFSSISPGNKPNDHAVKTSQQGRVHLEELRLVLFLRHRSKCSCIGTGQRQFRYGGQIVHGADRIPILRLKRTNVDIGFFHRDLVLVSSARGQSWMISVKK